MMLPIEPSDHVRVIAVIEPGKDTPEPNGELPVAAIVRRLRRSQFVEAIAVSSPRHDNALASWSKENQVLLIRDPEDHALARIARAAELLDADIIVRIGCGSDPVDPGLVDHFVTTLLEYDCDFVVPDDGDPGSAVEPFSRRALDKLMMDAHEDAIARELVTEYFRRNPRFVRIGRARPYRARSPGADTLSLHVEPMGTRAGPTSAAEGESVVVTPQPSTQLSTRAGQAKHRKTASCRALILCEAQDERRVRRAAVLAQALKESQRADVTLCVATTGQLPEMLQCMPFVTQPLPAIPDAALASAIAMRKPDVLVYDLANGLSRAALDAVRSGVTLIAAIDDMSDGRLSADLAYHAPLPAAVRLDWSSSDCRARIGWEWTIVDKATSQARPSRSLPRPTLVVSLDGENAGAQMLFAAKALSTLSQGFRCRFVVPPAVSDRTRLARAIVALAANFETVEGANGLAGELDICDLALVSFGPIAYALAERGVPALYLCKDEEAVEAACAFDCAGMGVSLGIAGDVREQDVAGAVWALLSDSARRRQMGAASASAIDGEGASRIAADIAQALTVRMAVAKRLTG